MPTIFADRARGRFYAVPDDAELAPGDVRVESLSGRVLLASPEALAPHQIDEARAKALVAEQMGALRQTAAKVASAAAEVLSGVHAATDAAKTSAAGTEQRAANVLGVTREALRDPQQVGAALGTMVDTILAAARDSKADPDALRARFANVAERVRARDPELADGILAAPERIGELLASDELHEAVDALTASVREATANLKRTSSTES